MSAADREREQRLAAALRANLRRRKGQKAREDLSGRDPKRTDTPLHQSPGDGSAPAPQSGPDPDGKSRRD